VSDGAGGTAGSAGDEQALEGSGGTNGTGDAGAMELPASAGGAGSERRVGEQGRPALPPSSGAADGSSAQGGQDESGSAAWDGRAPQVPSLDDADADPDSAGAPGSGRDESPEYDRQASRIRLDLARGVQFRDAVAGNVNYYKNYGSGSQQNSQGPQYNAFNYYGAAQARRAPGRVSVRELEHAAIVHVRSQSDHALRGLLAQERVVFCVGAPGTGRTHSAITALDHGTGYGRRTSQVVVLDAARGFDKLASELEDGCGHLLDGSAAPWVEGLSEAQASQFRDALKNRGFLIILVGPENRGAPLAAPAVEHERPDLDRVAAYHLAARFLSEQTPPDKERLTRARSQARTVIDEACQADDATRDWHANFTGSVTASPAEATLFADMIWEWVGIRPERPHAERYRAQYCYRQAAGLIRDAADSPLRQSYALSAAVLDGLALNEVIDGARNLAARLGEVEGRAREQRKIFSQPFYRWLRHVNLVVPDHEANDDDRSVGTVMVQMPSRELARTVVELAWREYDDAREPVLDWLKDLCEQHHNVWVRIRAVQALAYIAAHDYALIRQRVLNEWSAQDSRRVEHLVAAWLLEAMALDGTSPDDVTDLLKRWSRSPESAKREVAVLAYGTVIAFKAPQEAISGLRFSAIVPGLSNLPERMLLELYSLRVTREIGAVLATAPGDADELGLIGLTKEVTEELALWSTLYPARARAGWALVWISRICRPVEGEADGPFDLLWLLAHAPERIGISVRQLARLWLLACSPESAGGAAWEMLGRWAQSCHEYPELTETFNRLADEFETAAKGSDLRGRLRVYRDRWRKYIKEGKRQ
jgi:hypothetical protein